MEKLRRALARRIKRNKHVYRLLSPLNGLRHNGAMFWPRLLHGIDGNMVVFSAYKMRTYSDNPRYISEALHALRPQTDIVWLIHNAEAAKRKYAVPDYVRCLEFPSREASAAAGRAAVLVDNWRKRDFIRLGRKQAYIFAPHYDRGFKRAALTDPNFFYGRVVEEKCSLAVIASDVHKPIFEAMYNYHGDFLIQGLPRNDILVRNDPAEAERIRAGLGLDADTRVLLYAPTYWDSNRKQRLTQAVDLDLEHVLDVLSEATGEKWICLYRAHYLCKGLDLDGSSPRLVDATDYPEMAELLRIADALISDYSSCVGDFVLRYKPVWLYIADIEEYRKRGRDLLIDPRETPFWCAESQVELDELIRSTTPERARENCQAVLDHFGAHESGRASELVAQYIAEKLH